MVSDECKLSAGPTHKNIVVMVLLGSEGKYISLHASCFDSVQSLKESIQERIGIPIDEQELFYKDEQLSSEVTLNCSFRTLEINLVYKAQRRDVFLNPNHEEAWKDLYNFLFNIDLIYNENVEDIKLRDNLTNSLKGFLEKMPENDLVGAGNFIKMFTSSPAFQLLIKLCYSKCDFHIACSNFLIGALIQWMYGLDQWEVRVVGAPIFLELCMAFGDTPHLFDINNSCRSLLGGMMGCIRLSRDGETRAEVTLRDLAFILFHIATEIGNVLTNKGGLIHLKANVKNFKKLLLPVKSLTREGLANYGEEEIGWLEGVFEKIVTDMTSFLGDINHLVVVGCYEIIVLLHEIHSISHLFETLEKDLWTMLEQWKFSFSYLMIKHGRRSDDHNWILVHKELISSECRRHLAWLLFPKMNESVEVPKMVIERSNMVEQSFERIMEAEAVSLQAGFSLIFHGEEATGPGVKREWILLLCQALFDPRKDLFRVCPGDRRKIFPNSASKVKPEYFKFAGRVVALALLHKVHIGIVLDHALCLQLAERSVSVEDIRCIDPTVYKSCKDILNWDPESVDQDVFALTFSVDEKDESGFTRVVELVRGGVNIAVDSKNREEYVDLLIQHWFVKCVGEQVDQFKQGFTDIISSTEKRKLFFKWLESEEEFDKMLHGSERPICVEDWKARTNYHGYNDTDNQIIWFWEIVERMSAEQRKVLMFFWTAIMYLPVQGFRALPWLSIHRQNGVRLDCLPISHTCFNQLCFPPYSSLEAMEVCLNTISQEHIGCGFGGP